MIKANANFDNWAIPELSDLRQAWIGQFNNKQSYGNVPILTYDDFPQYIPGLSRNEALARFRAKFTGYVKGVTGIVPVDVDTWVYPVPPYPEVDYPFFPTDRLPQYYA